MYHRMPLDVIRRFGKSVSGRVRLFEIRNVVAFGAVLLLCFAAVSGPGCKKEKTKKDKQKQACIVLTRLKQSCLSGRGETRGADCYQLASHLREKNDEASLAKARRYYKYACSYGERDGCHNLGLMYIRAEGGAKKPKESREAFGSACRLGGWGSCMNLAMMQRRGIGGKKDLKSALALLEKACEAKEYLACGKLSIFWAQGMFGKVDLAKAIKYSDKGCAGGEQKCCKIAKFLRKRLDSWKPGEVALPNMKLSPNTSFGKNLIGD